MCSSKKGCFSRDKAHSLLVLKSAVREEDRRNILVRTAGKACAAYNLKTSKNITQPIMINEVEGKDASSGLPFYPPRGGWRTGRIVPRSRELLDSRLGRGAIVLHDWRTSSRSRRLERVIFLQNSTSTFKGAERFIAKPSRPLTLVWLSRSARGGKHRQQRTRRGHRRGTRRERPICQHVPHLQLVVRRLPGCRPRSQHVRELPCLHGGLLCIFCRHLVEGAARTDPCHGGRQWALDRSV